MQHANTLHRKQLHVIHALEGSSDNIKGTDIVSSIRMVINTTEECCRCILPDHLD